ncbi:alpha/beta hydrolase family protein [Leucobacter sp. HY1908]
MREQQASNPATALFRGGGAGSGGSSDGGGSADRDRRVNGWAVAVGVGVGVFAAAAAVTGAVVAGSAALARAAATPAKAPAAPVELVRLAREPGRKIAWLRGPDVALSGVYSFIWVGGHARLGEVIGRSGGLVGREVLEIDEGELREGLRGRITGWWYPSASVFARECDDVREAESVELPLRGGPAPAWVLRSTHKPWPGRGGRWAIHVHGRGALPAETLRGVAPMARAGVTSLVMSYRNDPGAPAGERGRYGFGVTEAADVDAAIEYALQQGATRVTLVGWSMGGTACLVAAARGAHRGVIDGLILDSPAVDWAALLRHQARMRRAPGALAGLGIALLQRGYVASDAPEGVDFSGCTPATFARELQVPTLIHASRGDTFVPASGAAALAALSPNLVQLRLVEQAEHVKLWNEDPEGWEHATLRFARALPRPAWRG